MTFIARLTLVFAMTFVPAIAIAQGFALGVLTGGLLFGGNNQSGGGGATILYTAKEEDMRAVDPLALRQVSTSSCFADGYARPSQHLTLGEIFTGLVKERPKKKKTILQIARVFYPETPQCASIWFVYTE